MKCQKLGEVGRSIPKHSVVERFPEVGVVCDMPEVYKIPMVRMEEKLTSTAKN